MSIGRTPVLPRGPFGLKATMWAIWPKLPSSSVSGWRSRYSLQPSNSHLPPARTKRMSLVVSLIFRDGTRWTAEPRGDLFRVFVSAALPLDLVVISFFTSLDSQINRLGLVFSSVPAFLLDSMCIVSRHCVQLGQKILE